MRRAASRARVRTTILPGRTRPAQHVVDVPARRREEGPAARACGARGGLADAEQRGHLAHRQTNAVARDVHCDRAHAALGVEPAPAAHGFRVGAQTGAERREQIDDAPAARCACHPATRTAIASRRAEMATVGSGCTSASTTRASTSPGEASPSTSPYAVHGESSSAAADSTTLWCAGLPRTYVRRRRSPSPSQRRDQQRSSRTARGRRGAAARAARSRCSGAGRASPARRRGRRSRDGSG